VDQLPKRQLCAAAIVLMACAACATTGEGRLEASTRPSRYLVRVVAASIDKVDLRGNPWHKQEPSRLRHLLEAVAGFYKPASVPAAAVEAIAGPDNAGRAVPPSPRVEVRVGNKVIQSPPIRTTLRPNWDWSFALDTREYAPSTPLSVLIVDDDGGELLGEFPATVGELIDGHAPPHDAGSVHALQLAVSKLPEASQPAHYHFAVPANLDSVKKLYDVQSTTADLWHPIEVLNGDLLRVSATERVTIHYELPFGTETLGPNGKEPGMGFAPKALEGCEDAPRGALVAIVSGKCLQIGAGREIPMVGESGRLLLLVNDSDRLGKNSGQFDVAVDVIPPNLQPRR